MVNLSSIDLNLLVVLHAVLTEQNATRAARRLGVTQSAVSNALARARSLFDDPLVVRHARGLTPTPRAESLRPMLTRLLKDVSLLLDDASFDPSSSTREFTLACADYYGMVVLPRLADKMRERAPHARLRVVTLEHLVKGGGLAEDVDVHVGRPPSVPPGCLARPLFEEEFLCLTRRSPTRARPRMSLREYRDASHVRVRVLDTMRDPIDVGLAKRGIERRIVLTVPHFSLLPWIVLETGYVATLSGRLGRLHAGFLPLELRLPPVKIGPRPVEMLWHQRTDQDPGARFFRELVVEASRAPDPPRP